AVLVLLFFLRNLRSTLVIALAIPLSILATLTLIYGGGLTLNLMTLGGLALGVGMMVDSAIVVLENIFRRRAEDHEDARTAAIHGSGEVATAIIASTITTLVIFLPLVFVQGVSGLLFRELALVVVFALIASLAVALTLVPMLAARFLARPDRAPQGIWGRFATSAEAAVTALDTGYCDLLRASLQRRWSLSAGCLLLLAASLLLWPLIGTEFMPPSDEGEVRVSGEMESGLRLELADVQARRLEALVAAAAPEAVSTVTSVSASGRRGNAATEVGMRINVGPAVDRTRSNSDIAAAIRDAVDGRVPGMEIRVRAPQGQFLLERLLGGGAESVDIDIRGWDLQTLERLAAQVETAVTTVPGVTDVENDASQGVPQEFLRIDRRKTADLGLSLSDVARVLESAVAGRGAGDYRPVGHSYRILVQLADIDQVELDEILDQTIRTPAGELVALRHLIASVPGRGPSEIARKDQERVLGIHANVAGRDLGSVAADIQSRLAGIPTPLGYRLEVVGTFQEQQEAFRELVISFVLALLLVYMVLASQYESLRDPLVVMGSVPLAAIGVVVTLFLTGSSMNIQSGIGCIMLGGIVVNNAILLVDQAGRLRGSGMPVLEAAAEAGRRRLRPILMTTLTTILGLLPLALGVGEGADAQAPLARAVIGGLLASTLITLLLIPALYSLIHRDLTERQAS
ncbi:MAG: efflux RND transporter permease subunit, partial [Planctomycetota bacterium]